MKTLKKISWLVLGVVLGAASLAYAGLPDDWKTECITPGRYTITEYPKASGATQNNYAKPRDAGIEPTAVVLHRHENFKQILPSWIKNKQSGHYLITNNGNLYNWIDEQYKSQAAGLLNNHVITVLIETPAGSAAESATAQQVIIENRQQALQVTQIHRLKTLLREIKERRPGVTYLCDYWRAASYGGGVDPLTGAWSSGYIANLNDAFTPGSGYAQLPRAVVQQWIAARSY